MKSAQKAVLADLPTDISQCVNDHKNTILIVAGIAFLAGCLLTSMSLSLGFAYYLRRQKEGSYETNQIEMQDTQLPFDEENEKKLSPRQLNWLQQNFVSTSDPANFKFHPNHSVLNIFCFQEKPKQSQKKGPDGFPVTQKIKAGSTEETSMKHRLEKQQQALAKKQAEMEALKAEVDPAERVKDLMSELRKTEPLCRDSNRSQV